MEALDPEPLLRFLYERGVERILIGGVAVAAHGYPRPSKDLDIVPCPRPENLARLAETLIALHARPAELGDFETYIQVGRSPCSLLQTTDRRVSPVLVQFGPFRLVG